MLCQVVDEREPGLCMYARVFVYVCVFELALSCIRDDLLIIFFFLVLSFVYVSSIDFTFSFFLGGGANVFKWLFVQCQNL